MRLVLQNAYDSTCGHACVAMLANTTIPAVVAALGHKRPTTWRELYSVLCLLGVVAAPKMVPIFASEAMPPVAVVQLPSGSPALRHVVVACGGTVYDPGAGGLYAVESLPFTDRPSDEVLWCAEVYNVAPAQPEGGR